MKIIPICSSRFTIAILLMSGRRSGDSRGAGQPRRRPRLSKRSRHRHGANCRVRRGISRDLPLCAGAPFLSFRSSGEIWIPHICSDDKTQSLVPHNHGAEIRMVLCGTAYFFRSMRGTSLSETLSAEADSTSEKSMEIKYGLISSDSHGQLGRDAYTSRMSKEKWGERIPHVIEVRDEKFARPGGAMDRQWRDPRR